MSKRRSKYATSKGKVIPRYDNLITDLSGQGWVLNRPAAQVLSERKLRGQEPISRHEKEWCLKKNIKLRYNSNNKGTYVVGTMLSFEQ